MTPTHFPPLLPPRFLISSSLPFISIHLDLEMHNVAFFYLFSFFNWKNKRFFPIRLMIELGAIVRLESWKWTGNSWWERGEATWQGCWPWHPTRRKSSCFERANPSQRSAPSGPIISDWPIGSVIWRSRWGIFSRRADPRSRPILRRPVKNKFR